MFVFTSSKKVTIKIYKPFFRQDLDCGDILYNNPENETLINYLEKVWYKACFAITGAIEGTSCDNLYQELWLESLHSRRWEKIIFFYRIFKYSSKCLVDIIPPMNDSHYSARSQTILKVLKIHLSHLASRNEINWIEQLEVCNHYPN